MFSLQDTNVFLQRVNLVLLAIASSVLILLVSSTYARSTGPDGNQRHMMRRNVIDAKEGNKTKTNTGNITWKDELWEIFKNSDGYKNNDNIELTFCFNKNLNGSIDGHFYCPWIGQSSKRTECCGQDGQQVCCEPDDEEKGITITKDDIIFGVSLAVGGIVAMSICLVLYCCCCQKRKGVHSGKLLWIRRGIKKEIYIDEEPDKPEHADTELIGFVEKVDNGHSERRRSSCASVRKESTPTPTTHVNASGQEMSVPLINIQASTPDQ